MLDDALSQLRDYGLIIPEGTLEVGKLKRVDVDGDRAGSRNGWYSLFTYKLDSGREGVAGAYGSWKRHDSQKLIWKSRSLPKHERDQIREQVKKQQQLAEFERNKAAKRAAAIATKAWNKAAQAGESAYCNRKGVNAYGLRYGSRGVTIVPMQDLDNNVYGLQLIFPEKGENGKDKNYWPRGLKKEGRFFVVGQLERGKPICIAEGYATAASIHEATGWPVVVAFDSGNILPVAQAIRSGFSDSPLIFCADDDWKTTDSQGQPYNAGVVAADKAVEKLGGYLVRPQFGSDRNDKDVDFNDLHARAGIDAVAKCFHYIRSELTHWRTQLSRSNNGKLEASARNVYLILRNDEAWDGVVGFSELASRIVKRKTPPYPQGCVHHINDEWRDDDMIRTNVWLDEHYGVNPRTDVVMNAIDLVARDNAFHPIREYLQSLTWDGSPRLDSWMSLTLGVEFNQYTHLVGSKFLIGAVARVMQYPCKNDCVLILEGAQGAGKSTALNILGGEWYSDTHFTLGDKDGYQQMQGVWICELAELDSFNKAESTRAKQFFASATDRYRPSYGRLVQEYARQCVFAGTTNQESYLTDTTGNRRYWPVRCGKIDIPMLERYRDQLWAEAYVRWKEGEVWHVVEEELHLFEAQQEDRFLSDAWEDCIVDWLNEPEQKVINAFSMAEIFQGALRMEAVHMRKPEQIRMSNILGRLGWKRTRMNPDKNGSRPWKYKRPDNTQTNSRAGG